MGVDKALDLNEEVTTQWEICVLTKEEGRPNLTQEERKYLFEGWSFEDKADEVTSPEESLSELVTAKMRGDGILANWREKRQNSLMRRRLMKLKV